MRINFEKIQATGNDFVVFDNRDGSIELSPKQVRFLCDRHFGVGADGIIEVRESPLEECRAYMHYLNADGSLAEMCGNGVRCFARFLVEQDMLTHEELSSRSFVVDTLAGPRPLTFELNEEGQLTTATVCMGEPSFAPERIPTTLPATQELTIHDSSTDSNRIEEAVVQAVAKSEVAQYVITTVNMGNPHAVIFLEYMDAATAKAFIHCPQSLDLKTLGSYLESNTELFPQKTNVEVAAVNGTNRISMRVYERGVGETLSCGTGACATAVAAIILGDAERDKPVTIEVTGGELQVEWLANNQVTLTGPAETVFCGSIELN